jgi:hypothetical protein
MSITTLPKELEWPNCPPYITKCAKSGLPREQLEEYVKSLERQVEVVQDENKDLRNKVQYWENAYETYRGNYLKILEHYLDHEEEFIDGFSDEKLIDVLTKRGYVGTLRLHTFKDVTVGYPKE